VHAVPTRFLPGSMLGAFRGDVYITWLIVQTFTIALRAIFQSLRYLPLVGNVYHNLKHPPCATPGPYACHGRRYVKAGRILFLRSLIADALVPRDTSRREHQHPTSTPCGLKRVAGVIGKQISVLKATVAKFKRIRPSPQRLPISSTKEATWPASPQTDGPLLAEQSKTVKGPLLPATCFRSPEEDPELENVPLKAMETQLSSGSEVQVKQTFSMGSGPVSENDVVRQEARLPSMLEVYDGCHRDH